MRGFLIVSLLASICVAVLGTDYEETREKRDTGYGPPSSGYGGSSDHGGGYSSGGGGGYGGGYDTGYSSSYSSGHGGGYGSGYGDTIYYEEDNRFRRLLPLLALAPLALLALAPLLAAATSTIVTNGAAAAVGAGDILVKRRKKRDALGQTDLVSMLAQDIDTEELQAKMLGAYASCGMDDESIRCLQQLACKYEDLTTSEKLKSTEREMAALMLNSLVNNPYVSVHVRNAIYKAAYSGRKSPKSCETVYKCKYNRHTSFSKAPNTFY